MLQRCLSFNTCSSGSKTDLTTVANQTTKMPYIPSRTSILNTKTANINTGKILRHAERAADADDGPTIDLTQQLIDATQLSAYLRTCTIALSLVLTFILLVVIGFSCRRLLLARKKKAGSDYKLKPFHLGKAEDSSATMTTPAPAYFSDRRDQDGVDMV
jgi:hypothetical protein